MKRKHILTAALIFFGLQSTFGQIPQWNWARSATGNTEASTVTTDTGADLFVSMLGSTNASRSLIQKQPSVIHLKDDFYLKRSKSQKVTAKSLLYTGLGLAAVGGIVQLAHENRRNGGFNLDFTGAWMAIGGGFVSLFSVPFFISSGLNARKAAILSLSHQSISIPQSQYSVLKAVPSATLKIEF